MSHWIVPRFAAQKRHRLIFLTRSTEVDRALQLEPTDRVVFSWSVNAEEVAGRWEVGVALEVLQRAGDRGRARCLSSTLRAVSMELV